MGMFRNWLNDCNMKKYGILQLKRVVRFLPWALCVVLVLFGCMSVLFYALTNTQAESADAKIRIGVVSATENKYLQWGLAAMQFDSTAMSLQLVGMEEAEAVRGLERGKIAAYVVFPENFIEDAMTGDVGQLRLVSTVGATGLISIFKEEVTVLVDKILSACENGAYRARDAVADNGLEHQYYQHVNDLSLEYVDFLFHRNRMYRVENLAQDSLTLPQYMLGGLTVLLLMLCCLPFAPLFIRHDYALDRMLCTRQIGPVKQTLAEFGAYFAALLVLLGVMAVVLRRSQMLPAQVSEMKLFLGLMPTLLMAAALSYCLYTLSGQLVGGILLSFFAVLLLGFAGGCMYPVQIFPLTMQRLAGVLPSGVARQSVTGCFWGETPTGIWPLLGYSAGFLALSVGMRSHKTGSIWR